MTQWSVLRFVASTSILILVCLGACATPARRPPQDAASTFPQRTSLTALYKVAWSQQGTDRRARLAVVWTLGKGLRLEILGPLGGSRAVLISNHDKGAILLDPRRRRFLPFETGREAVWQVTGLDLDPELIPLFLFGDLRYAPRLDCSDTTGNPGTGQCFDRGSRATITLEKGAQRGGILFENGARIQFRQLKPHHRKEPLIPGLELRDMGDGVRVELILKEASFEAADPDLFSILPPRDFLPDQNPLSFPSLGEADL